MHQKIAAYIKDKRLFAKSDRLLVAVSGGVDSVVLLHLLVQLGYDCTVAHCNFHLRGEESNRDFKFVQQLARTYNLPFFSTDFATQDHASERHLSVEMAARELRYNWFSTLLDEQSLDYVVVAHHADDAVETFFINLTRGSGIHGLAGMKAKQNRVVRPLLLCKRSEIEDYACKNKLCFVYDSTNSDTVYLRNFIRHKIVPQLETINPSFTKTMLNTMSYLRDIEDIYNEYCQQAQQEIVSENNGVYQIPIGKLLKKTAPQTLLYEILSRFGFNSDVSENVFEALQGESGRQFFSNTHRLVKDREMLLIEPIEDTFSERFTIDADVQEILEPLHLQLNKQICNSGVTVNKSKSDAFLDVERLTFPLVLRRWQNGDRFVPFGMKQQKKVSDFLIDNKLSLIKKDQTWVLTSQGHIVWVVGQRIDDRYKITRETKEYIHIKLIK